MKLLFATLIASIVTPVFAQIDLKLDPIAPPENGSAIPLYTGVVHDIPAESWFVDNGKRSVRNVSIPTLTPVLPAQEQSTGAAVILLPGGAFSMLSMDNEGWSVADQLAREGVTVFILKYRINATPITMEGFKDVIRANIAAASTGRLHLNTPAASLEDARQAFRLVRANAKKWGVDPTRIGMIGFSAGAQTVLDLTVKADAESMPAFIGSIYGPMTAVTVPSAAPPMFVAYAADDPLFGNQGMGLAESWQKAGKAFELHVYQRGGHGFGLGTEGTTTLDWKSSLLHWLSMNHFLKPTSTGF